ncbi:MAG: sigma-70 family RNA polymerase sigma factor [Planctomycetes bacterium]|nr:sigma-70 family RNA polymerase sigma factor [Planctomycetota bacterium]
MPGPDRDTFDRLVHEHHAAVYRSALRIVRRAGDAEDVAQEVFLRVLAGKAPMHRAEEPQAALCWLATRLALNHLRAARRRDRKERGAAMPESQATPADDAADHELHATVRVQIDALPDDLRLPLLLRYQDRLTFAALGSALALSESTAHERVQEALARLRQRLAGAGLAVAPARLAELVAVADPAAAPVGLQTRLLALRPAGLAALPAAGLATLGGLAVIGVVALASAWFRDAGSSATVPEGGPIAAAAGPAVHPQDPAPRPSPRTPVADPATRGAGAPPAPRSSAAFSGTVHDALAWPLAGARVAAVAAGNLKPFELAATRSDASGAFRLEVPLAGTPVPAERIRIRVTEGPRQLLETAELELPRDGDPAPLRLTLPPDTGTEASRFTLAVTVRDAAGRPVADVPVALYAQGDAAPRPGQSPPEAESRTGADGVAALDGRSPGAKLVFGDGRRLGFSGAFATVTIERPGAHRASLELVAGATLHARLALVGGGTPEWANVWLEDETTHLQHSGELRDGAVEFTGLGPGPFTLRVYAHPYSPARRRGLRPGPDPVQVLLKLAEDPRAVGHHMAEVHGTLLDAATGATVAFEPGQVEAHPVRDGDSTLAVDRIEPPRPVQRMLDRRRIEAFHVGGLEPGEWAVVARVPGYAPAVWIGTLAEAELRTGVALYLQRGAEVAGRVVDDQGVPVAGALVFVAGLGARADANLRAWEATQGQRDARAAAPAALAASARTGDDGRFVLRHVPGGVSLRVVAVAPRHRLALSPPFVLREGEVRADVGLRASPR